MVVADGNHALFRWKRLPLGPAATSGLRAAVVAISQSDRAEAVNVLLMSKIFARSPPRAKKDPQETVRHGEGQAKQNSPGGER